MTDRLRHSVDPPPLHPPPLDIAGALAADLADLAVDLADGTALASSISMLRRDLRLDVRAFLGFTLTITTPPPAPPVGINVVDSPVAADMIADRLTVEIPSVDRTVSCLTVYAARPHALDRLRDDFGPSQPICPEVAGAIPTMTAAVLPGITGLQFFAEVHRAIGVLLAAGHTAETAGLELLRRAHTTPGGLTSAVRALLDKSAQQTGRA